MQNAGDKDLNLESYMKWKTETGFIYGLWNRKWENIQVSLT